MFRVAWPTVTIQSQSAGSSSLLRAPLAMSQVKQCQPRSLRPSRSSHSWSSVQRCNLLIAPSQPTQLPVLHFIPGRCCADRPHPVKCLPGCCPPRRRFSLFPRYLLTWQCRRLPTESTSHLWMLPWPCKRSHTVSLSQDVSTQMGSRPASSFSVDMFVQTPIRSSVLLDVAIQLPITEFFIGCILSNDPLDRQNFVRQSPSSVQDDTGNVSPSLTCTLTRSNLDCDNLVRTLAPRALMQPPPGLEQLAPPPGLAIDAHLCTTHGTSVTAAPVRSRLRSAISVTPPQPPACTIHVGTHHARSANTGKRSASTALMVTHNLAPSFFL